MAAPSATTNAATKWCDEMTLTGASVTSDTQGRQCNLRSHDTKPLPAPLRAPTPAPLRAPTREQVVFDVENVEYLADNEVHEVVDGLRLGVEARHRRHDD